MTMTNKWLLLMLSGKCNFLQVIIVSADTNSKLGLIMVSGIWTRLKILKKHPTSHPHKQLRCVYYEYYEDDLLWYDFLLYFVAYWNPVYWHQLTEIMACIRNYGHWLMWNIITHSCCTKNLSCHCSWGMNEQLYLILLLGTNYGP